MEGEWLFERTPVQWRGNGHVREVVSLMDGEWSCYGGGQFKGGENGHVTEVVSLMERMVLLLRWLVEG